MQGMLVFDNEGECHNLMDGGFVTREGALHFFGQVNEKNAYILINETQWDSAFFYNHPQKSATEIRMCWINSLGKMSYTRSVTLALFEENSTYVDLCAYYRKKLEANEKIITLSDKIKSNPKVKELIGTPIIYSSGAYYKIEPESTYYNKDNPEKNTYLMPFSEIAKKLRFLFDLGIKKGHFHLDGWSYGGYDSMHPRVLPVNKQAGGNNGLKEIIDICKELNYGLTYHDQYRDYFLKSPDYTETKAVVNSEGKIENTEDNIWYGGDESQLCAKFAPEFLRRNCEGLESDGLMPDGVYLDVFSASILDECYSDYHRMSRRDCSNYRKECFKYLRSKGLIVSSEEIMEEFCSELDLVNHSPYINAFMEFYGREKFGVETPLINLVFHDCIVTPWYTRKEIWGLPKNDSGILHCLLNGGVPCVEFGNAGEIDVKYCDIACRLNNDVAFSKMVSHEFLSDNYKVQKTVFSNGTKVTVDFSNDEYFIELHDGNTLKGKV